MEARETRTPQRIISVAGMIWAPRRSHHLSLNTSLLYVTGSKLELVDKCRQQIHDQQNAQYETAETARSLHSKQCNDAHPDSTFAIMLYCIVMYRVGLRFCICLSAINYAYTIDSSGHKLAGWLAS